MMREDDGRCSFDLVGKNLLKFFVVIMLGKEVLILFCFYFIATKWSGKEVMKKIKSCRQKGGEGMFFVGR
jgi:hypothetical protein